MRVDNIEKILIVDDINCDLKQLSIMLNSINDKIKLCVIFKEFNIPVKDLIRFFSYLLQNKLVCDLKIFIKDKNYYKEALKYKNLYTTLNIYYLSKLGLQNLGYYNSMSELIYIPCRQIFKIEKGKLIYESFSC